MAIVKGKTNRCLNSLGVENLETKLTYSENVNTDQALRTEWLGKFHFMQWESQVKSDKKIQPHKKNLCLMSTECRGDLKTIVESFKIYC